MIKTFFTFILFVFFSNAAYSKADTTWYYMKSVSEIYDIEHYDTGVPVDNKEDATFIRGVISKDAITDSLYQINDYYLNGKVKFIANSKSSSFEIKLEGVSMEYFINGHKKRMCAFHNGKITGEVWEYFPNGQLNTVKTINDHGVVYFKQCLDSAGNTLTKEGIGKWVEYHNDYKEPFAEGMVKNGLEEGEWNGKLNDTAKYLCTFHEGNILQGKTYCISGNKYSFEKTYILPQFKGGMDKFGEYLGHTINYPLDALDLKKQGRVLISFVVEKNGLLSSIRVSNSLWPSLDQEALKTILNSPQWNPCYKYGLATAANFAVPISFSVVNH